MPVKLTVDTPASSSTATGLMASNTGGSFTPETTTVKVCVYVSTSSPPKAPPSSVTVTVIVAAPFASATLSSDSVRVVPLPVIVGFGTTVGCELVAVNVSICAASSVPPPFCTPVIVTSTGPPSSSNDCVAIVSKPGASLTGSMVMVKLSVALLNCVTPSVAPSSVAVTVIVTVPFASVTGANVSTLVSPVPLNTGSGTIVASLLVAVNVTVWVASSAPPPALTVVMLIGAGVASSSIVTSAMASNDGASFSAVRLTVNTCDALLWCTPPLGPPEATSNPVSVAATSTLTAPAASAAGVNVSVAVDPDRANVGLGMSVGLKLVACIDTVCESSSPSPPGPMPVMVTVATPLSSSTVTSEIVSNTGALSSGSMRIVIVDSGVVVVASATV